MAKIKWSKGSIEDLKEISRFIATGSPHYAEMFIDRIFELVEHLEYFPEIGRGVPEANNPFVKELIFKGYRIIYQLKEEYLEIVTIIHGSRLLKL